MNFLAHYYFDGKAQAPYYNLGLILPDLMGMVSRGWKLKKQHLSAFANADHHALAEGVKGHLLMDEWFHETAFFYQAQAQVKAVLTASGIGYPPYRVSFLSHIMLEIMVDRLIVQHYPHLVHRFYYELGQTSLSQIKRFFLKTGLPYNEGFGAFFPQFVSKQYAFRYTNDQAFIHSINQIAGRVSQPSFTNDQQRALSARLPGLDAGIAESFRELEAAYQ